MRVIIDRFEGNFAVCEGEGRKMLDIERSRLPKEAAEGDVLVIEGDSIVIDREETEKRKKEIEKLMEGLWE